MNLGISMLSYLARRQDFGGISDKYSPTSIMGGSLANALQGVEPLDVRGNLFSENYRDASTTRLARYLAAWNFYDGRHWLDAYDDGMLKPVTNYCAMVADKGSSWFAGKGMKIEAQKGNEPVAEFLNRVWDDNNKHALLQKQGLYGAVTGDIFYYVTVETKDENQKPLPVDERRIIIAPMNPSYVFPFWSESKPGEMSACLLQFPLLAGGNPTDLYTIYITPENFEIWINQEKKLEAPNPFGRVNVIHSQNLPQPTSLFGQSDIEKVIPLNEEYNTIALRARRIIEYHAEPTTVIYGVRASKLEKGANKVWSNLPVDAKVENLEIQGDVGMVSAYLDRIERQICYLSSTPKVVLESEDQHLSNTSGLAMQMKFQPIIEKTQKKQSIHCAAIKKVNDLILIAGEKFLGLKIDELADNPKTARETTATFISLLPKDEQTELDLTIKKVEAGLMSRAEAIRRVTTVSDTTRHVIELAADKREELAVAYETQQANIGNPPALSVAFLGSAFLSEDLQTMAKELSDQSE